ncbi:hypothetical protein KXV85_011203, partial [Aspergillus fumigatus]
DITNITRTGFATLPRNSRNCVRSSAPSWSCTRRAVFGDGAADGDDAPGVFDTNVAVARVVHGAAGRKRGVPVECPRDKQRHKGATSCHDGGHLVRISLFCKVSRIR